MRGGASEARNIYMAGINVMFIPETFPLNSSIESFKFKIPRR